MCTGMWRIWHKSRKSTGTTRQFLCLGAIMAVGVPWAPATSLWVPESDWNGRFHFGSDLPER